LKNAITCDVRAVPNCAGWHGGAAVITCVVLRHLLRSSSRAFMFFEARTLKMCFCCALGVLCG